MNYVTPILLAVVLAGCQTTSQNDGSLSDYSVSKNAYVSAYDRSFAKASDRQGWSQPLQVAWSRGAAAEVCGLPFNREAVLGKLARKFPEADKLIHDLNGLRWHSAQISKAGKGFCTEERKAEAGQHI